MTLRTLIRAGLGAASILLVACPGTEGSPTPTPATAASRSALLAQVGGGVILPTLRELDTELAALATACATWSTAASGDGATARAAAQDAWRAAAIPLQRVEVLQVGPAGSPTMVTGGQGLRDEIYSWPTVSPCTVDETLVSQAYAAEGFGTSSRVNARGMAALEYLLFHDGTDNACEADAEINTSGAWAALGQTELDTRRAAYAAVAAAAASAVAHTLVTAWEPEGGGFATTFAEAGGSGSPYASAQAALDELFAALYYVELDVKDMKLAEPAGLSPECASSVCPEAVESRYAHASKEHIRQNLLGFRMAFTGQGPDGVDGAGFDDLLSAMGAGDLATQIVAATDDAIAKVEAIPGDLDTAVSADPEAVQAAYAAVQVLTTYIKSQLVTVLNLTVPEEGAGDND